MAFLRSLRSRQIWRVPSEFLEYVGEDTHSVGLVMGVMIPGLTNSSRVHSIRVFYGYLPQACWIGGMEGSVLIVHVPGMLQICVKGLGKGLFEGNYVSGCCSGWGCNLRLGRCAPWVAIWRALLQAGLCNLCTVELGRCLS